MLAERGVETLQGAVAFGGIGGARHSFKLALAEDLPACPGVYVMRDREGAPLYVGKAGNLRRRVRSYFGPGGRHSRLIGRALERLDSIDHETCGSEFAALLREDQLIKELSRRATGAARAARASTSSSPRRRRPRASTSCRACGRTPGPTSGRCARSGWRGRRSPACGGCTPSTTPTRPCAPRPRPGWPAVLRGDAVALGELGLRLGRAVAGGTVAVDPGEGLDAPRAVLGTLAALARARRASARFAVLVERGEEPHVAEAFFVAGGVVRHRAPLDADAWAEQCREGLAVLRRLSRGARGPLAPEAMDEAAVIEERLREAGPDDGALVLSRGWRTVEVLEHIGCAVRRLAESMGGTPGALPDG